MGRHIIQAPDGTRHIVEGPDASAAPQAGPGAGAAQPPLAAPPEASPERFTRAGGLSAGGAGVADAAIKGALGIKQLFGGLSDENKAVLEQMKLEKEGDPNGGLRTGFDIATNFLPGLGAAKVASKIPLLAKSALAAPGTTAALSGGVQSAALTPTEGDTYSEQMANKGKEGLKSAALGAVLQKALGAIARPFRPSAEAEQLFKQGFNPTLQQGADRAPGKFVGGLTAGAFKSDVRQRDEAANAWLKRVTEGNQELKRGTGQEFVDQGDDYVGKLYDQLWKGKKVYISPKARADIYAETSKVHPSGRGAQASTDATAELKEVLGESTLNSVGRAKNEWFTVPELRTEIRNKLTRAAMKAEDDVRSRLMGARDMLDDITTNKVLTTAEKEVLLRANNLMFDVKRGEEAIRGGRGAAEGFDVKQLNKAYEASKAVGDKIGNKTHEELVAPIARMMSTAGNQHSLRSAVVSAGRTVGPVMAAGAVGGGLPGAGAAALAMAPLYGASLLGQTAKGAKVLLGQTDKQRRLAELLRGPNFSANLGTGAHVATGEY